ncbi:MAG: hydroxyacylglutathione hydrolase [Hyphomicrobium sp.]|nr:MAG: hydroxyacylglutathione hydrolase [Hyphomicrobium sp.]PPC98825.1 MAG: hydroxyacylglutathione hydrolase [Hyphomicrobium sp.]
MPALEIIQIPCLSDNYCVLIHAPATGETAAIDAPAADTIKAALSRNNWRLTHILTTHHHNDHTGANMALKAYYGCQIWGPETEADRIPGLDVTVNEQSKLVFAGHPINVIATPGHTLGHIAYVLPDDKLAFTGDTLFALGCGRIFEGVPETMWRSLSKLAALPSDTTVYCGHEYTLSNGRFALSIEPENEALKMRMIEVERLRAAGLPTLPTTIAAELATNPFLRTNSPAIRARLGMESAEDWQVFAQLRALKNKA